jgi:radical SAM protein with 4Fe4S-binding SPASM domain
MKQIDITYETPSQPRQVRLDTTTRCNASCTSCHRFYSQREGEMPPELIGKVLRDIARWPAPLTEIIPVNYGEFFLREDWAWILSMVEKNLPDTQIVLPTNGSLITPDTVSKLCKVTTLKIINFSVNAFYEDTYRAFMGLKEETPTKIVDAIKQIKVERPDIIIWVSMVFDPEYQTDRERDDFVNFWRQYAYPQILPAASAGRRRKKPEQAVKLPCRSIFSDMVVGYDGRLSLCCFDADFHIDLGEYSGNLKADWKNAKIEELRRLHNEHKRDEVDLCKQCTFA